MENFINMKNRINLQSIGGFIRDGGSKTHISCSNFEKREDTAFSKLEQQIIEMCGADKTNKILDYISEYSSTVEEIYFSLGMKVGANLQVKLLDNLETDI